MNICEKANELCMRMGCPHGRPHEKIADCSHTRFRYQRSDITKVPKLIRCRKWKIQGEKLVIWKKVSTSIVYGDIPDQYSQDVIRNYGTTAKGRGVSLPMWLLPIFEESK